VLGALAAFAGAPAASAGSAAAGLSPAASTSRYGVGEIVITYTDYSRHVWLPGARHAQPRRLETIIRYPATIAPGRVDVPNAPAATKGGPFPIIVFAHGFNVTPSPYAPLLQAWAHAGYVVAAPIFPLTNSGAPGGPDEADLVNQPTDVSFVITQMLSSASGTLAGLIDPHRIAVTGQSDGGSTALAVAYDQHYFDSRIDAAMILSGAEIPGIGGYTFPSPSPPLLAVQGTGDTVNAPASTYHFFGLARHPKFLLSLLGAPHLGPYTNEQPQLGIVERVTIAFLDHFLKHRHGAGWKMWRAGNVARLAALAW
jgi:predicted dienelactone hydrolase